MNKFGEASSTAILTLLEETAADYCYSINPLATARLHHVLKKLTKPHDTIVREQGQQGNKKYCKK
jgi:hypothetical protein